jgi:hypothetical protein
VDTYFLPPEEPNDRVPRWARIPLVPHSVAFRAFFRTTRGTDVDVEGTTYLGGRWHGPLSSSEITAITNAGYSGRLVSVADGAQPPPGIA